MANKNNAKYDFLFSDEEKEKMRQEYLNGETVRGLCEKYNIRCTNWVREKLLNGITRTFSEANKLAHQKYPERFKLSDEAKAKVRVARLKFMKEHPEQTAWRKAKNNISYPEKCFIKYLQDRGIDKKYLIEREKPFFPYFADFAFEQLKLVIEIDGSQHLEEKREKSDERKDELIRSLGWSVIRITEDTVKHNWLLIDDVFKQFESNMIHLQETTVVGIFKSAKTKSEKEKQVYQKAIRVGIFKAKKTREKKERLQNGLTEAQYESSLKQQKCVHPSKEELAELIKTNSYRDIGKMFGVSDSAVRKWAKKLGVHESKRVLRVAPKKCLCCSKEFIPSEKNRKYCSVKCANLAKIKGFITYDKMVELLVKYNGSTDAVASIVGLSEKTIRNRCEKLGIKPKDFKKKVIIY